MVIVWRDLQLWSSLNLNGAFGFHELAIDMEKSESLGGAAIDPCLNKSGSFSATFETVVGWFSRSH